MEKPYCGIDKLKKGQKKGNIEECVNQKQIRLYGLNKVDKNYIDSIRKMNKGKLSRDKLIVLQLGLKGRLKNLENKYKDKKTSESEKKKINEEYKKTNMELMRIINLLQEVEKPIENKDIDKKLLKMPKKELKKLVIPELKEIGLETELEHKKLILNKKMPTKQEIKFDAKELQKENNILIQNLINLVSQENSKKNKNPNIIKILNKKIEDLGHINSLLSNIYSHGIKQNNLQDENFIKKEIEKENDRLNYAILQIKNESLNKPRKVKDKQIQKNVIDNAKKNIEDANKRLNFYNGLLIRMQQLKKNKGGCYSCGAGEGEMHHKKCRCEHCMCGGQVLGAEAINMGTYKFGGKYQQLQHPFNEIPYEQIPNPYKREGQLYKYWYYL